MPRDDTIAVMVRLPDLAPLIGAEVTRISFDYQVTLLLADVEPSGRPRVEAVLVIGTPFTVAAPDSAATPVTIDPNTGGHLATVLDVLHSTVEATCVEGDESLTLVIGGFTVHVPRDHRHESWQLEGDGVDNWLAGPF